MKFIFTIFLTLIIYVSASHSETFCVTNSDELQSALTTAQSNNQTDLVKIAVGDYLTSATNPGFEYNSFESYDIEINGGWYPFFDNPCSQQLDSTPYDTVLDGTSSYRVLRVRVPTASNITIKNILFINGFLDAEDSSNTHGGGVKIVANSSTIPGEVTVENNAFINNTSKFDSAISLNGNLIHFNNNLVTSNHSFLANSVGVVQNDNIGTYFINNTIVTNTTDGIAAGFRIWASGTSKAYIANNILANNSLQDLLLNSNGIKYLYNNNIVGNISGVADIDSANFSDQPQFDPGILNFTPAQNSVLVDAGRLPLTSVPIPVPFEYDWTLPETDLVHNERIQYAKVDIGAYESPYEGPIFMNGFD